MPCQSVMCWLALSERATVAVLSDEYAPIVRVDSDRFSVLLLALVSVSVSDSGVLAGSMAFSCVALFTSTPVGDLTCGVGLL